MNQDQARGQTQPSEPEFRAYRRRVLYGCQALCLLGLVSGFLLKLPYVTGLAVIGLVVSYFKLATMNQ